MCLKQSISHSKWILQAIFSLSVLSDCVLGSLKFDTIFLFYCIKFCSVFSGYWIGNLMRILKMFFKQSFFHFKWILQTSLSLTVFSDCVLGSLKFDTLFLSDCTKFGSVFFMLLDRKFNEDSKNVHKTVSFSLKVDFTGNFVLNCLFRRCFRQFKI